MADFAFATAEIEDGTGKTGAVVYEDTVTVIAALASLGKTSLAGGTTTANGTQETAMRNGTAYAEAAFEPYFRGAPSNPGETGATNGGQGLLWPAQGALSARGIEWQADVVPLEYLRFVRHVIEEEHAGTLRPAAGRDVTIEEVTGPGRSVRFRNAVPDIAATHPHLWREAQRALPPVRI